MLVTAFVHLARQGDLQLTLQTKGRIIKRKFVLPTLLASAAGPLDGPEGQVLNSPNSTFSCGNTWPGAAPPDRRAKTWTWISKRADTGADGRKPAVGTHAGATLHPLRKATASETSLTRKSSDRL